MTYMNVENNHKAPFLHHFVSCAYVDWISGIQLICSMERHHCIMQLGGALCLWWSFLCRQGLPWMPRARCNSGLKGTDDLGKSPNTRMLFTVRQASIRGAYFCSEHCLSLSLDDYRKSSHFRLQHGMSNPQHSFCGCSQKCLWSPDHICIAITTSLRSFPEHLSKLFWFLASLRKE